jgi:FkbM family methyltransferase
MLFTSFGKVIDKFTPSLGRSCQNLRDRSSFGKPRSTAYGFALAGSPLLAEVTYEADQTALFLELLGSHDVVIDIGANVGFYSCLAASRAKRTIAIEPFPRNLNFLLSNLSENRFTDVEVFPMGLGRTPGLKQIYGFADVASFVPGWNSVNERLFSTVPITTLDTIAVHRFQGKKLLIKLDVEGFELEVLAGSEETVNLNPRPTWLIEVLLNDKAVPGGINPKFGEVFELFWKRGYSCRSIEDGRKSISQTDVERWVANGKVDGDKSNFMFFAA